MARADPSAASANLESLEFDQLSQGAIITAGIGTGLVGDDLMIELGGESLGMRSLKGHQWLVQWDAFVSGRGGWLAHQHPYTPLLGGAARANGEAGYRFSPASAWSSYLGARVNSSLLVMAPPGVAFSALDTINNSDGFAGISAGATGRIGVGASRLDSARSLLLVAFIQEALRAPETHSSGAALLGGGLSARYDIVRRLTASLEGFVGKSPNSGNQALHYTNQTTYAEVTGGFRWTFERGVWWGLAVSLARETDHTFYTQSRTPYDTAHPPSFGVTLALGVPIGRQQ